MKSICLIFRLHQPLWLKRYHFFDIGNDHHYYDDYSCEETIRRLALLSYLPATELLLNDLNRYKGKMKFAFCLSGVMLEQLWACSPKVTDNLKKIGEKSGVEFLHGTYSNSLASLAGKDTLKEQTGRHWDRMKQLTGNNSVVFMNSELIYSDVIGADLAEMGFRGVITEGARHLLGWRSPCLLYCNTVNPRLKVLLRHSRLSRDLACCYSDTNWKEYPLTPAKFLSWINTLNPDEEVVNIVVDLDVFGNLHPEKSGIFKFLDHFIFLVHQSEDLQFSTPSEIVKTLQPVSILNVPDPISWADQENTITPWIGNDLQSEALSKLYELAPLINQCGDPDIIRDWNHLQSCDHFFLMSFNLQGRPAGKWGQNPCHSPYEAFINYMNVLSDFRQRLALSIPGENGESELARVRMLLKEKENQIKSYQKEIERLERGSGKPAMKFKKQQRDNGNKKWDAKSNVKNHL